MILFHFQSLSELVSSTSPDRQNVIKLLMALLNEFFIQ